MRRASIALRVLSDAIVNSLDPLSRKGFPYETDGATPAHRAVAQESVSIWVRLAGGT